jgi:hypothetical protein
MLQRETKMILIVTLRMSESDEAVGQAIDTIDSDSSEE